MFDFLMASVAAGMGRRTPFQEDGLDAALEKLIIQRLRRRAGSSRKKGGRRQHYKTGTNSLRATFENHNPLQKLSICALGVVSASHWCSPLRAGVVNDRALACWRGLTVASHIEDPNSQKRPATLRQHQ